MNILSFNNQNLQKLRNTQKTHMCSRKRMETLYQPRGQETVAWKHITLQFIHLPSKITFEGILIITKNKKNIDLKLLGLLRAIPFRWFPGWRPAARELCKGAGLGNTGQAPEMVSSSITMAALPACCTVAVP